VILVIAWTAVSASAQTEPPPDPREAKPERPTVATHAYAVAAGIVELEAGFQWQRPEPGSSQLGVPALVKIGLGKRVQLDISPGWVRVGPDGHTESGFADTVVGVKWQIGEDLPVLEDFAIQPTIKLPTGSVERGTGTGTTDLTITVISSRSLGPIGLDLNVAYTRRSGDGSHVPIDATLWTISSAFPVKGPVAWTAELFGYPGTSGPAGSAPVVALLTGPTVTLQRSLVLDAGVIFNMTGFGGTAVYAGATWNMGRIPWATRTAVARK
jgi:hypothetical protein